MGNQQGEIMISFTKENLEYLYTKFKSVRRIAREIGISKSTLDYYFKKFDIDCSKKPKIKKAELEKLFKELGSVYKVAEHIGLPSSTIYSYIYKYNIDISRKRFPYSKQELIELHKKYGSITKVAANLSRSYSTVRHWYKELNIVKNKSGMTIFQEIRETPMSPLQKSVLVGSMLGDGGIWLAPHSKNARLYVCHCEKQLNYLKWVHDILQPFSRKIVQTEKAGKKLIGDNMVNGSNFYRFFTIAHPSITELFHKYYKNGLKHVDATIINKIDLVAMAIWFGDDGSVERNRKGEPIGCSIATNSFSYKEQVLLSEAIRKFFKGKIRIVKQCGEYKGKPRSDFKIRMSDKYYIQEFLNNIKLILPECIHYKLS